MTLAIVKISYLSYLSAPCLLGKKLMIAGWSSLVARWAHNPKVGGSNPPPSTLKTRLYDGFFLGINKLSYFGLI